MAASKVTWDEIVAEMVTLDEIVAEMVRYRTERDRLRKVLKGLLDALDQHAVMSFGWAEDNARAALQELSDDRAATVNAELAGNK